MCSFFFNFKSELARLGLADPQELRAHLNVHSYNVIYIRAMMIWTIVQSLNSSNSHRQKAYCTHISVCNSTND